MDFEGDTLELQVEKVSDGLVRVSTNAPAVASSRRGMVIRKTQKPNCSSVGNWLGLRS